MKDTLPDLPAQWDDPDDVPPRRAAAGAPPADPWAALRRHTPARISLGRAGTSLPTAEVLRFAGAHAQARDAVHLPLDVDALAADLHARGHAAVHVRSRAATRTEYLTRPDLGRLLDDDSRASLERVAQEGIAVDLTLDIDPDPDAEADTAPGALDGIAPETTLCVVVGDGLSAIAGQSHATALVDALQAALDAGAGERVAIGLVVIATQARVALGDDIGALLQAPLVLMLLGERPGLSSPDSLGAYLTWDPRPGRADSERNCVSNIRPDGLALDAAAGRIAWLVRESLRRRVTGIALKDDSDVAALGRDGDGTATLSDVG